MQIGSYPLYTCPQVLGSRLNMLTSRTLPSAQPVAQYSLESLDSNSSTSKGILLPKSHLLKECSNHQCIVLKGVQLLFSLWLGRKMLRCREVVCIMSSELDFLRNFQEPRSVPHRDIGTYLLESTLIKLNFSELVKTVLVEIEKSSSFSKSDNIARYGKQQKLKDRVNFPGEEEKPSHSQIALQAQTGYFGLSF